MSSLCDADHKTQGLMHARQAFYQLSASPAQVTSSGSPLRFLFIAEVSYHMVLVAIVILLVLVASFNTHLSYSDFRAGMNLSDLFNKYLLYE